MKEGVKILDWDSKFFGVSVASIQRSTIDQKELLTVLKLCEKERVECLYFLTGFEDVSTIKILEKSGFFLVDVKMTLEINLKDINIKQPGHKTRISKESDIQVLKQIANNSYWETRFYFDNNFNKDKANELYQVWVENSCTGYADVVLVADEKEKPVGFISCHLRSDNKGSIGLVGVDQSMRGKGIGNDLLMASYRWFADQHIDTISVVTQARNIEAQRLYQSVGMKTRKVELWYHKWFE